MKATGVIRRIDDLGRIVIPKEIRKNLRMKVGESIEIYVDDNENIVLKKFSMVNKINDLAQELTDAIYTFMKHNIMIIDNNSVIAASGPLKKDYLSKPISDELQLSISKREKMLQNHFKEMEIIEDVKINCSFASSSIICDGEVIGMILIFSEEEKMTESEMQMADIISSFISKYVEE